MDLVFKRYSSPFLFLDVLIENNNFSEGIDELFNQQKEERWWELYLATLPLNEKTYECWRKEMEKEISTKPTNSSLTKKEIEASINKAQNILDNFNPLYMERG